MPLYEFKCDKCGFQGELKLPMSEFDSEFECARCDGIMKRIPSYTSFELKGGGWAGSGYTKGE